MWYSGYMIYFTSDSHYNHENIMEALNRPFKTVSAMNAYMVKAWNKVVKSGDRVYHLGDFGYRIRGIGDPLDDLIRSLNGCITLIRGNHDRYVKKHEHLFHSVVDLGYMKLSSGDKVMLCHYPMRTWRASHHGSFHLHGHSHGKINPSGKMLDVGVDCHDFRPISENDVRRIMELLPDNENLIKENKKKT